jgi:hypothetical protein
LGECGSELPRIRAAKNNAHVVGQGKYFDTEAVLLHIKTIILAVGYNVVVLVMLDIVGGRKF